MKTQAIERFEVMDAESLATVEGGGCSWKGAAKATGAGAIAGAFGGGLAGAGIGAAGGYFAYSGTCWW